MLYINVKILITNFTRENIFQKIMYIIFLKYRLTKKQKCFKFSFYFHFVNSFTILKVGNQLCRKLILKNIPLFEIGNNRFQL